MQVATSLINRVRELFQEEPGRRRPSRVVADIGGRLVYIGPTAAEMATMSGGDRTDLVATWSAPGSLTWGEAQELLALDESTSWGRRR